jgi:hypothetical protein
MWWSDQGSGSGLVVSVGGVRGRPGSAGCGLVDAVAQERSFQFWEFMRLRRILFIPLIFVLASGCSTHRQVVGPVAPATLAGDPAHPDVTKGWVDTKLYFGLGLADRPEQGVSEADWRSFLDREVTPRFPSGLSVVDVYGQWQGKNQTAPERLRSKMLIIDYQDSDENRAKIEAIRTAWKQKTGDQSVMRVTEAADVSF